jgi:enoyl-CoA hydratase/carnithine racemase
VGAPPTVRAQSQKEGLERMADTLRLSVAEGIATVTLARPPVNAVNAGMVRAFGDILDELQTRADWRVLHVRSALAAFSAGADLNEIRAHVAQTDKMAAGVNITRPFQALFQRISDLPQVSLAEIGGAALGTGLELALGCDLRIAANEAMLGLPEVGLGLVPGGGGTQRLTWIAGPAVAARIVLAADTVDGKTARELGMLQWAVPRQDLATEANTIAVRLAGLPPLALAAAKVAIRLARDPERNGFAAESEWTGRLLATEETERRIGDFLARGRRHGRGR